MLRSVPVRAQKTASLLIAILRMNILTERNVSVSRVTVFRGNEEES